MSGMFVTAGRPGQIALSWRDWTLAKWRFAQWTGLSDDALHTHAGLIILMACALLLRRPPWTWKPWLLLVVVEAANEAYDLAQTLHVTGENMLKASAHDFWLTLLWPTVILLLFPPLIARTGTSPARSGSDQTPR